MKKNNILSILLRLHKYINLYISLKNEIKRSVINAML